MTSSLVAAGTAGTLAAVEPYGPTNILTIYAFTIGEVATVETVYLRCHADGSNQEWDGTVVLRLIDQTGLVLYAQATPEIEIPTDADSNPDEFELTWSRGANASFTQTGPLGTPAEFIPNFVWATMPLPDAVLRGGSQIQVQGFLGYVNGQLVSDLVILEATVTLTELGSDASTTQGIPLLTPTDNS